VELQGFSRNFSGDFDVAIVARFKKYGVSGSFPVRFFHRYVFSTTSPLRFPVRSGSLFGPILCFQ